MHKIVVCGRSDFFKAACNSFFKACIQLGLFQYSKLIEYKEGQSDTIALPEDDPQAVKLMLHYLYTLDYPHQQRVQHGFLDDLRNEEFSFTAEPAAQATMKGKMDRIKKNTNNRVVDQSCAPNLVVHARLYALGEKYGIQGLKALSLKKFEAEAGSFWNSNDFPRAVEEVYRSTLDHDRALRDAVTNVIVKNPQFLDSESAQNVVKSSDLCFDLMMAFRKKMRHSLF